MPRRPVLGSHRMKRSLVVLVLAVFAASVSAQNSAPASTDAQTTLRVSSRAVLVDVIVTDQHGKPVTGLKQDAFTVTEQGKPQAIDFFEEHHANQPAAPVEMPRLPQNVFSNFSPFPQPPAVNVLLLDSLNTRMESQSFVHQQALDFLKSAKPGSRMAIFAMGLGLHFIQGFNDDPAVLMAALKNKKNNEVETSVMLKGADESNAQQNLVGMMSAPVPSGGGATVTTASPEAIASLQNFLAENDTAQSFDRMYVTLANLQKLAAFLQGFPGRKNIIWFAEKVPALFVTSSSASVGIQSGNPGMESEIEEDAGHAGRCPGCDLSGRCAWRYGVGRRALHGREQSVARHHFRRAVAGSDVGRRRLRRAEWGRRRLCQHANVR